MCLFIYLFLSIYLLIQLLIDYRVYLKINRLGGVMLLKLKLAVYKPFGFLNLYKQVKLSMISNKFCLKFFPVI